MKTGGVRRPKKSARPAIGRSKLSDRSRDLDEFPVEECEDDWPDFFALVGANLMSVRSSPSKSRAAFALFATLLGETAERRGLIDEADILRAVSGWNGRATPWIKAMAKEARKAAKAGYGVNPQDVVVTKAQFGRRLIAECQWFLKWSTEDAVPREELSVEAASLLGKIVHDASRRIVIKVRIDGVVGALKFTRVEAVRMLKAGFELEPIRANEDPEHLAKRALTILRVPPKEADNILDAAERMTILRAQRRPATTPNPES